MSSISLKSLSEEKLSQLEKRERNNTLNVSEKIALKNHRFLPKAVDAIISGIRERRSREELISISKFKVIDRILYIDRLELNQSFDESLRELKSNNSKYYNYYWVVEDNDKEVIIWEGPSFVLGHMHGSSSAIYLFQYLARHPDTSRAVCIYNGITMCSVKK